MPRTLAITIITSLFPLLTVNAQYQLNSWGHGLSRHIVLVESSGEKGEGILISTKEPYHGKIYLLLSLTAFTKGFESSKEIKQFNFNDTITTVTHYFKKEEKSLLNGFYKEIGEQEPLKIQFNFKTLVDSTSCVTFFDSSDVVLIKLYDRENSIQKKFINWISLGSLWPMNYNPKTYHQTNAPHNSNEVVYVFSEHSENAGKIYLMDIALATNKKGWKFIPLYGTDYTSTVVFKVIDDKICFHGIANNHLEVFPVNLSSFLKE